MTARANLTPEQIATIHRMAREGQTRKAIAYEAGCSRESVRKNWPEDVQRRIPVPLTPEQVATIERLAREGKSAVQIERETGCNKHQVFKHWPEGVPRFAQAGRGDGSSVPIPDKPDPQPVAPDFGNGFRDVPDSALAAEERWRKFYRTPERAETIGMRSSMDWV